MPAIANPSTSGAGHVNGTLTTPDAPARRRQPVQTAGARR